MEPKVGIQCQCAGLLPLSLAAIAGLLWSPVEAHNEWANGKPVPNWIKAACCGPADAHRLTPAMVRHVNAQEAARLRPKWRTHDSDINSYYVVDWVDAPIYDQNRNILPSQDGDYWIFYRDADTQYGLQLGSRGSLCSDEPQSNVFCFFIPMDF